MGKTYACGVGALAVLLGALQAVQAAAVTRTFALTRVVTATWQLDPSAPDFTGVTGTGSFGFDDSLITGSGDEFISGGDLHIDLTIFGQSFTEADDVDFDTFPVLVVSDGTPRTLDFVVSQQFVEPSLVEFFTDPRIDLVALGTDSFRAEIVAIPLPGALALALSGVSALGPRGMRRRVLV